MSARGDTAREHIVGWIGKKELSSTADAQDRFTDRQ